MKPILFTCLLLAVFQASIAPPVLAQQVPDSTFSPAILHPAFEPGKGPRVAIDEAHHNFHTVDGRYQPFATLLRRDGFRVEGLSARFSPASLTGIDVLVIANALNERNAEDWSLPTPSAFTPEEIADVRAWVEKGGSLFLIADHMPFAGAASELARAFGVEFSNGYARAGSHPQGVLGDLFEQGAGLAESAVTRGRSSDEHVTKVVSFTGSAFKPPVDAVPVLSFGANSVSIETTTAPRISPEAPEVPVAGWCQGAILSAGAGRLAVFGEAAMFSAQLAGPDRIPVGMNAPDASQNSRFLLNVVHWLCRAPGTPD